jgi:hypothetical protein
MNNTPIRYLFTLLLILQSFKVLFPQNQSVIDSLNLKLQQSKDDSNKVNLLIALSKQYNLYTGKENLNYLADALNLALKCKNVLQSKKLYKSLVLNAYYKGIYDLSLSYCLRYLQFLKDNGFDDEKYSIYKTLGNLYLKQGFRSEALRIYHQARTHLEPGGFSFDLGGVYNSLCLFYLELKLSDSAEYYARLALHQFEAVNQTSAKANSILALAEIKQSKGEILPSLTFAKQAFEFYRSIKEYHGMCNALEVIGDYCLLSNKVDSARIVFEKSLRYADSAKILIKKTECYERLSQTHYKLQNYKAAFDYLSLFKKFSDSISVQSMQGKMLEMEVKYDLQTKETELSEKEKELKAQSKIRNLLLIGIVAVILLLLLALYAYVQKRKSNKEISEQKRLIEQKQKEVLDSIRYAKRIQKALITNEHYIQTRLKKMILEK